MLKLQQIYFYSLKAVQLWEGSLAQWLWEETLVWEVISSNASTG